MPENEIEDRILDATEQLIIQYGYNKVTIDDIADRAGISKSTFYKRWKNRDAVFEAVLMRASFLYLDVWAQMIADDPDGGSFEGIFKNALLALYENAFLLAIYRDDRQILGSFLKQHNIVQLYSQRIKTFTKFLIDLQEVGIVRPDIDVATLAYLSNCLQYGVITLNHLMPDSETPDLIQALEMMMQMIRLVVQPDTPPPDLDAGKRIVRNYVTTVKEILYQGLPR